MKIRYTIEAIVEGKELEDMIRGIVTSRLRGRSLINFIPGELRNAEAVINNVAFMDSPMGEICDVEFLVHDVVRKVNIKAQTQKVVDIAILGFLGSRDGHVNYMETQVLEDIKELIEDKGDKVGVTNMILREDSLDRIGHGSLVFIMPSAHDDFAKFRYDYAHGVRGLENFLSIKHPESEVVHILEKSTYMQKTYNITGYKP